MTKFLTVFLWLLLLVCCMPDKIRPDHSAYLRKEMASDTYPADWTKNKQGVSYYKNLIAQTKDSRQVKDIQFKLASQYLDAGENEICIQLVQWMLKQESIDTNSQEVSIYYNLLAQAYFRKGELLNCQQMGNNASCIIPFDKKAIYTQPESTRISISYYQKLLSIDNKDYSSMWMLNMAYASLGQYPDSVPHKYFINLGKYDNPTTLKPFVDIAPALGVATPGWYGGSDMEDFNNDGLLDLFCCSFHMDDPVHLYINDGNGGFSDRTNEAGLKDITGGTFSTHADYDNDGYADILIVRGGWLQKAGKQPCTLLHNNGNGTYTDVTVSAGLLDYRPSHSACWADVNNDGYLDLFIAHERWNDQVSEPSKLYLNNGDGTFRDGSRECGIMVDAYVKGCVFGDINNDGRPDLYLSIYGGHNLLYLNSGPDKRGNVHYTEIGAKAGVQEPFYSFPCAIFDYDNDGWEDILCTGYSYDKYTLASEYRGESPPLFPPKLYHNNHDNTFTDVAATAGLNRSVYAMGLNYADIDNDGYLDIYAATGGPDYRFLVPNLMFRNNEGKNFQDVTKITATGHLQKGHSVSFGDIDNNGSTDLYVEIGGLFEGDRFRNALFYNPNNENKWVGLKLAGTKANRSAIGARIKVVVNDKAQGERCIYRTVSTGASYGANSLEMNIGLGTSDSVKYIEVIWPRDHTKQTFYNIRAGHFYEAVEGSETLKVLMKKRVNFTSKYPGGVICN